MSDQLEQSKQLVKRPEYKNEIQTFETKLIEFIANHGLPTGSVLVPVSERLKVFANVESILDKLTPEQKATSVYVSKFIAASAAGLFDAALNYLWDETIQELRKRVAQYDLSYFFDIAVKNPDKKKNLRNADDLAKIDDFELINGANEIGLVSDLGHKHLDYIRYMRNWASAAHPNQNQISGLQVVSWLETCITEVINLPQSAVVVEIKKLLSNIKSNTVSPTDAKQIGVFFAQLAESQVDNLASGFFGIFVSVSTNEPTRQNIRLLIQDLWPRVSEPTRKTFGVKYAQFVANNDANEQKLAREFLDVVRGASYIPDGIRAAEIGSALEGLLAAHHGFNNFYTEPAAAKQVYDLVAGGNDVPNVISQPYALAIVEVFLTNGNGVAWNAQPTYTALLSAMGADIALIALLSFTETTIASRLQLELAQAKFKEMISILKPKISAPAVKELLQAIERFSGPLYNMRDDTTIKSRVASLKKLLNP
jgi:hypothetical protein